MFCQQRHLWLAFPKALKSQMIILTELEELCKPGPVSFDKLHMGMTRAAVPSIIIGYFETLRFSGLKKAKNNLCEGKFSLRLLLFLCFLAAQNIKSFR
jgi:hypothetical protein